MQSLKGHFLVATPSLADPNFHQTVLLMLEHSTQGAAGVVLNRLTGTPLSAVAEEIFDESIDWETPIHLGGPVPGPLMALHGNEDLGDSQILDDLFTTVDPEKLRQLIRERPEPCLFLANYAGWGPGQLESEFGSDSWYAVPATAEQVFATTDPSSWSSLVGSIRLDRLARVLKIEGVPPSAGLN
jgi:putative transcriptional regulator